MNANELADILQQSNFLAMDFAEDAATMLRQQQERIKQLEETQEYLYKTHDTDKAQIEALKRPNNVIGVPAEKLAEMQTEIEALKQIIDANNLSQSIGQFVKPTNEPVAWMDKENNITMIGGIYPKKLKKYLHGLEARIIAIESHPVKELTREDRLKLIGTLKWAEDLLREAGHDEVVSDAQDCLMILRKAQE